MDEIITDIRVAIRANRLLYPADDRINVRVSNRRARWLEILRLDRPDLSPAEKAQRALLEKTVDAYVIFLANMAARYGSNWETFDWQAFDHLPVLLSDAEGVSYKRVYLPYHQAEHPTWMVGRLREIYEVFHFDFVRCCALTLSVGPHDLEQLAPGLRDDGVGRNEWKSAEEARAIMIGAGFDIDDELEGNLIERVMLNICGTTFSFDPSAGYLGPLAPHLVERVRAKYPDWQTNPKADEEEQDLLLTADVDTATVTDFAEYGTSAADLCREMIQCRPGAETLEPVATMRFLTDAQERFWELQTFHSRYAQELLQPRKERNRRLLDKLIGMLRERFRIDREEVVLDKRGRVIADGQPIVEAFVQGAAELAAQIEEEPA